MFFDGLRMYSMLDWDCWFEETALFAATTIKMMVMVFRPGWFQYHLRMSDLTMVSRISGFLAFRHTPWMLRGWLSRRVIEFREVITCGRDRWLELWWFGLLWMSRWRQPYLGVEGFLDFVDLCELLQWFWSFTISLLWFWGVSTSLLYVLQQPCFEFKETSTTSALTSLALNVSDTWERLEILHHHHHLH